MDFILFSVSSSEKSQIFYNENRNLLKFNEFTFKLENHGYLTRGIFFNDEFFGAISSTGMFLIFDLKNGLTVKSQLRLGNFLLNNILFAEETAYITSINGLIYTVECNDERVKLISTVDLKSSIISATLGGEYFLCLNSHREILLYRLANRFLQFEKRVPLLTVLNEDAEINKIVCSVHPTYKISLLCAISKNKLFILHGKSLANFEKFDREFFNLHNIRDVSISKRGFLIPVLTDKLEIFALNGLVNGQTGNNLFTKLSNFSK